MSNRIQVRRDTAANWTTTNPVLAAGEPALETDTGRRKTGDGTTAWTALPYVFDKTIADGIYTTPAAAAAAYAPITGSANYVAPAAVDSTVAPLIGNPTSATATALNAAIGTAVNAPVAVGQQAISGQSRGYGARVNRKSVVRQVALSPSGGTATLSVKARIPSSGNNTVSATVEMTFTARANAGGTFFIGKILGVNGQNGSPVLRLGTMTNTMGTMFYTSGTANIVLSNTTVSSAGDIALTLTNYGTDNYTVIVEINTLDTLVGSSAPAYGSEFYAWWGDSLTVGGATTAWGTMSGLAKIPVMNRGVSGDASSHIAARAMGIPSKLTAAVTLPNTGSVPVLIDTDRLPTVDFARTARIGGRSGILSQISGVRNFTVNTPGPAVTLPIGTPVYYPDADSASEMIEVVWAGTNDLLPTTAAQTVANILAIVQRNKRGQVLVIGALGNSGDILGTAAHTQTLNVNTALAAMFGPTFLDIWAYLKSSGLADAGITPTAQDNIDLANDVTPTSLRSDALHLSNVGYGLVGTQAWNALSTLGFTY